MWTATYEAWLRYLLSRFGIVGDDACANWTRLYRLPHVVRDGVRQERETSSRPERDRCVESDGDRRGPTDDRAGQLARGQRQHTGHGRERDQGPPACSRRRGRRPDAIRPASHCAARSPASAGPRTRSRISWWVCVVLPTATANRTSAGVRPPRHDREARERRAGHRSWPTVAKHVGDTSVLTACKLLGFQRPPTMPNSPPNSNSEPTNSNSGAWTDDQIRLALLSLPKGGIRPCGSNVATIIANSRELAGYVSSTRSPAPSRSLMAGSRTRVLTSWWSRSRTGWRWTFSCSSRPARSANSSCGSPGDTALRSGRGVPGCDRLGWHSEDRPLALGLLPRHGQRLHPQGRRSVADLRCSTRTRSRVQGRHGTHPQGTAGLQEVHGARRARRRLVL